MRRGKTTWSETFSGLEALEQRRLISATMLAADNPDPAANLDWGDAPNVYHTTLLVNGPRHNIVAGFSLTRLGDSEPDAELDGQPSTTALLDNKNGVDDEKGVAFLTPIVAAGTANIRVFVEAGPAGGMLDGWIDFNNDGKFGNVAGSVEHVFVSTAVSSGANDFTITVPAGAVAGYSFARFRLSTTGGLAPGGYGGDGEVEDYKVYINPVVAPPVIAVDALASTTQPAASTTTFSGVPISRSAIFDEIEDFEIN